MKDLDFSDVFSWPKPKTSRCMTCGEVKPFAEFEPSAPEAGCKACIKKMAQRPRFRQSTCPACGQLKSRAEFPGFGTFAGCLSCVELAAAGKVDQDFEDWMVGEEAAP